VSERVERPCPLCASDDFSPHLIAPDAVFGFRGEFHVVRCRACGMFYTRPQIAPDALGAYYPADYAAHQESRAVEHGGRRGSDPWDCPSDLGEKRLLDVGCGSGHYLLRMKRQGWRVCGVEPDGAAVAAARRQELSVVQGVIPGVSLPDPAFDLITLLGVIAMIPDPLETLQSLRALLAPQGRLIISTPNADSAAARVFGPDWFGWDLPRQQNHFTAETLAAMLRKAGFGRLEFRFKFRSSRWRHGIRRRADRDGGRWWLLAGSRNLGGLWARLQARGCRSDEIIAVAEI